MPSVISIEKLSKAYRLGEVGTGTLAHDLNRWWHRMRGKEDPYAKVATLNDRTTYGEDPYVWALKDIDLALEQGDVLGVIGANGAGKSTLLKILSRVTGPTEGTVKVRGRLASLLEVGTGFHCELTGRENIYLNGAILGMRKSEIDDQLDRIVEFAGIARYLDTPVKRYSSGMTVRLGFAVAAHLQSDIMVVDEVLSVGDAEFQARAGGRMKTASNQEGRTVLFVSHSMKAIREICTKCIRLDKGILVDSGTPESVIHNYSQANATSDRIGVFSDYPTGPAGRAPQTQRVSLLDEYGELISGQVQAGEPLFLQIDLIPGEVKRYDIRLILKDLCGGILAVSSAGLMHAVFLSDSDSCLTAELDTSILPVGDYAIDLEVYVHNQERFEQKGNACGFQIVDNDLCGTGFSYGSVWNPVFRLPVAWSKSPVSCRQE